ncbi:hypothetical protein [Chamaesiphon sp.]|uniref:hypothetical protein n=1 Tax=Chamaesiphon sp. TaxID=2814140 RepID=UPI003593D183
MPDLQPDKTDAILGEQTPPPVNALVLGGVAGIEQQLINQWGSILVVQRSPEAELRDTLTRLAKLSLNLA